jgi:hypothetical protein
LIFRRFLLWFAADCWCEAIRNAKVTSSNPVSGTKPREIKGLQAFTLATPCHFRPLAERS